MTTSEKIRQIYNLLLKHFGHQNWWPGESKIEVAVGAVLTQNTNWKNVEKAIGNLKKNNLLNEKSLNNLNINTLAELIRPAGYYNIKAKRLKNLIKFIADNYDCDIELMAAEQVYKLREKLLAINGIGRETADSILLYSLEKPVFVVDTYTFRILYRHGIIDSSFDYEMVRELFENSLNDDIKLFNEFHALIVETGKKFCKPKAQCSGCPLDCFAKNSEAFELCQ